MKDRSKIIDLIEKLTRRAKCDASSEAEVAMAINTARKLMDEYNVSDADLFANEESADNLYESMTQADAAESAGTKVDKLHQIIAGAVDAVCDTRHYYRNWVRENPKYDPTKVRSYQYQDRCSIKYFGLPRDVAVALYLHEQLWVTVKTMSRVRVGKGWGKEHWDYCRGFVYMLRERARAARNNTPSDSKAVVLSKDTLLQKYEENKLDLVYKKPRGFTINDPTRFNQGRQDAKDVNLSTNGLQTSTPQGTIDK